MASSEPIPPRVLAYALKAVQALNAMDDQGDVYIDRAVIGWHGEPTCWAIESDEHGDYGLTTDLGAP